MKTVSIYTGLCSRGLLHDSTGSSTQWNTVYNTVNSNSGLWTGSVNLYSQGGIISGGLTITSDLCVLGNIYNPQANKRSFIIGNGIDTEYIVSHNLNTKDVIISLYDSNNEVVLAAVKNINNNQTLISLRSPISNIKVVIINGNENTLGNTYTPIAHKRVFNIGNDVDLEYVVDHNLNTTDIVVNLYDSDDELVIASVRNINSNQTLISFDAPIHDIKAVIVGIDGGDNKPLANKVVVNIGNGIDTEYVVTHDLNTKDLLFGLYNADDELVLAAVKNINDTQSLISFKHPVENIKVVIITVADPSITENSALQILSGNWQNTYNIVSVNSSSWAYQATDIKSLTSNWESVYNLVNTSSALWNNTNTGSGAFNINQKVFHIGNEIDTDYILDHNLNTKDLIISVYDSEDEVILTSIRNINNNQSLISFRSPVQNIKVVVITGTPNGITSGDVLTTKILKANQKLDKFTTYFSTIGSSVVNLDCINGQTFYISSTVSQNWTANLTNLSLSSGYSTVVKLIILQGATGRIVNALQIDGSSQTIRWEGGTPPTGNSSKRDVITFELLNNAGTYIVLGQLVSFG